jgi:catechol 2,3-dioxygenase-like lactoylglutathione lyase family enzyme
LKLNQVTLPATDLDRSIAFYERLGFMLIVKDGPYARPSSSRSISDEKPTTSAARMAASLR